MFKASSFRMFQRTQLDLKRQQKSLLCPNTSKLCFYEVGSLSIHIGVRSYSFCLSVPDSFLSDAMRAISLEPEILSPQPLGKILNLPGLYWGFRDFNSSLFLVRIKGNFAFKTFRL